MMASMGVNIPNLPNGEVAACKMILLFLLKKIEEKVKETPKETESYVKMLCVNIFAFNRKYKNPQEFIKKFMTFKENVQQTEKMEKEYKDASFVLRAHMNKYFDYNEEERKKINLGHGKYDPNKVYKKASCELMVTEDVLLADLRGVSLHTSQKTHNQRFKSLSHSTRAFKKLKLLKKSDLSAEYKQYWKEHAKIVQGVIDKLKDKKQKKKNMENVSGECKNQIGDAQAIEITDDILPKFLNFEKGGVINKEVIDQGECGSCWAMSLASMLESRQAYKTLSTPIPLSRKQILDCTPKSDCKEGNPAYALQYVLKNKDKLSLEADYAKYNGKKEKCAHKILNKPAKLPPFKEFKVHKKVTHAELKFMLLKGPLVVQLDAKQFEFIYYRAGILKYKGGEPNHTLLLIGYVNGGYLKNPTQSVTFIDFDKESGDETKKTFTFTTSKGYWILRNSWGKKWGTDGNVLIEMDPKWDAGGLFSDVIEI